MCSHFTGEESGFQVTHLLIQWFSLRLDLLTKVERKEEIYCSCLSMPDGGRTKLLSEKGQADTVDCEMALVFVVALICCYCCLFLKTMKYILSSNMGELCTQVADSNMLIGTKEHCISGS